MAEYDYNAYRAAGGGAQPLRVAALANWFGAVLSLSLVAGIGYWSYNLMVRDVTGIPVVRALEGPMRISPDNPGGRQAAYQGLAVNAVAADGQAGGIADEVVLAPQPIDLTAEDVPARSGATPSASDIDTTRALEVAFRPGPDEGADDEPESSVARAVISGMVVEVSPRPRARAGYPAGGGTASAQSSGGPDLMAQAAVQALTSQRGTPRQIDIDPATLAPGTRLVQLGVFDTAEIARAEWDTLATRFSPHLDARGRVVEAAQSGGQTFYRLRAHGFEDEGDSRRFCAVLLAQNADCIPALIR
ncbi:SPOR domain-containing protein [Roseicitreum antarcticum]|uniref:Sporulation related domain-containing protein n=1 Tax=Roseicitreum antarcticum TaxID=564137 RepID=A0A1H3A312_9RHOB|nr:SPOR domain-containing protein [Roseicitreum antarcticum]SDX24057.1 Sporulation related domain-containing protein [Roseicitreum antarcticum]